jgi:hypothetical protein
MQSSILILEISFFFFFRNRCQNLTKNKFFFEEPMTVFLSNQNDKFFFLKGYMLNFFVNNQIDQLFIFRDQHQLFLKSLKIK